MKRLLLGLLLGALWPAMALAVDCEVDCPRGYRGICVKDEKKPSCSCSCLKTEKGLRAFLEKAGISGRGISEAAAALQKTEAKEFSDGKTGLKVVVVKAGKPGDVEP